MKFINFISPLSWRVLWLLNFQAHWWILIFEKKNELFKNTFRIMGHKPKITFIFIGSFSASTAWIYERTNSEPKFFSNWFRRFLSLSKYSTIWKIILRSVTICDWTWIWVKNARNNWHRSFSFKFSKRKIESPPGKKKILHDFPSNTKKISQKMSISCPNSWD